ncbi:putative spermidine/putrescine transport system substrate-binding protein [Caldanaerovirga acetigignens]|uniref:Putative spermidine/putrescine transport system substrate-binding protein n=1 Tax=Caldanaerovirga acetigignens TaxID=447595 RepID=A0A1M7HSA6_9FIRM|nr:extracellular solute-binding protein [Caldanaerovirga acetigignens]SHM31289.1 putative spermidine/putrescine transport system substrate-binding protein [Caldanaerovirga acetigignens]
MKKIHVTKCGSFLVVFLSLLLLNGCKPSTPINANLESVSITTPEMIKQMEEAVKNEKEIVSYGLPDDWANWKESWEQFTRKYNLVHHDTDMSSAEEIQKFKAERNNPKADVGDIGIQFAPIAVSEGVTMPYKNSYWNEIPNWAKHPDGHWVAWYTGTMSIAVNKNLVPNIPRTFKDLLKPEYKGKIAFGDPRQAANANWAIFAANFAMGGDETNVQPGLDFFRKLAESGNLIPVEPSAANIEKGEAPIVINWDFLTLAQRDRLKDKIPLEVIIPEDGTVIGAYVSIINKWAPHPNAAKLWQEFVFSDQGQINLAKGYARPIRKVDLPPDVAAKLLPESAYKSARAITDWDAFEKSAKKIAEEWSKIIQLMGR